VGMTLPAMATIAVTVVLALGWRAVRAG